MAFIVSALALAAVHAAGHRGGRAARRARGDIDAGAQYRFQIN